MLNQRLCITDAQVPLLQTFLNEQWHLIVNIRTLEAEVLECTCVRENGGTLEEYLHRIYETPFYVAEGIWEMQYGSQIMTLLHDSLENHPATAIWQAWSNRGDQFATTYSSTNYG